MSRKDTLRALLTARDRKLPDGNSQTSSQSEPEAIDVAKHVRSGAVGAMGRSLGKISHAVDEARALIAAGNVVVEIEPDLVEVSFVPDRFDSDPSEHAALVASIREHGQQVPILVRPHPTKRGRYQAAYGHRRLRALRDLGRPVRAVVRELDDADLIVAQGQENSARLDLSYIERALFAMAIEDQGFDRSVIMDALSIEKTQLSRLLSIARAIPSDVARAIGPAPKTGRPRWQALAELLGQGHPIQGLEEMLGSATFLALPSDARFARIYQLAAAPVGRKAERKVWSTDGGAKILKLSRDKTHTTMVFDDRIAPEFSQYVLSRMDELYRAFADRDKGSGGQ